MTARLLFHGSWRLPMAASALSLFLASCSVRTAPFTEPDPTDPNAPIGETLRYVPEALADDSAVSHEQQEPHHGHHGSATSEHPPAESEGTGTEEELVYACPMHPDITGAEGAACPKCGMAFVRMEPLR